MNFFKTRYANVLATIAGAGLVAGGVLWWIVDPFSADIAWSVATAPILISLFFQIVNSLRKGDVGLDVIAALSMSAALAFGEPLAGNVVAMMYASGQLLETFAQGKARREMTALMGRVAHTTMLYDGVTLREVPIASVKPADRLLIRQGEVLPVDGRIVSDVAVLNLSALTGESLPRNLRKGEEALSGSTSAGPPFDLIASRPAAESTYAGIVRLVESAQASKAPMVRMADRYALGFLALTIAIAAATWLLTKDTSRVLAVLVSATPCPLILAVPVALIAGVSRTASIGVLIKGGAVLETLAKVRTVILDKTGTLTHGQAEVTDIKVTVIGSEAETLRLAASLDQASGHVVATALIREAAARGLSLTAPLDVAEVPGTGIEGTVEGRRIVVGGNSFVHERCTGNDPRNLMAGVRPSSMTVAVSVDGKLAGVIVLADRVRKDAGAVIRELRQSGVSRIVLASGDRLDIAQDAGALLGVDLILGDLSPDAKVAAVSAEHDGPVMMVGDGVNDAPALAAADVGVAMGAHGTASSSEVAGVVLLIDELGPLAEAMAIARRSRMIAFQSVVAGLGLSLGAMAAAAFGYLPPVQGALFQEVIDVAVILNALRALR
ncbi:cadmium-translocating P-type ATPase [Rhizobium sp. TH2]|uniref:heavy metal translocating P-type ATPase n=1 Tax=Rhizobium sp. TH2 TaxID=2775403 RepID=UPI00215831E8|nr:heavy metal translocating P-type ATPase [Rhizobium sp. TH2]UVC08245.1 cadmium-translocating P-type ATPase [Rhizobium sp. TH2]